MKFDITAGGHAALVDLETDGKGGFAGSIESGEFGNGSINGIVTGDYYSGAMILDGHHARFEATVSNGAISGAIHAGWFFSQAFTGKEAA